MLSLFDLTFPIVDATELYDIRISEFNKLLGRLLAAVTASAIYQNQLILIGELGYLIRSDAFVRNIDRIRNMPCGKFVWTANIKYDVIAFACHHFHSFAYGYLLIRYIFICRNGTSCEEQNNKKDKEYSFSYQSVALIYRGERYFSDGITTNSNGKYSFFIMKVNDNNEFLQDIFEFEGDTITDCINEFENAPIWNGKTFYDVENEMKWVDW